MLRLVLSFFVFLSPSLSASVCRDLYTFSDIEIDRASFTHLPSMSSGIVKKLKREIQIQVAKNHSYAVIDLHGIITPRMVDVWSHFQSKDTSWRILFNRLTIGNDTQAREPMQWQQVGMKNLGLWLKEIIEQALTESLGKPRVEFRAHNQNGEGVAVNNWHVDGGKISVVLSMYGPGVEVLGSAPKLSSPGDYLKIKNEDWLILCKDCHKHVTPTLHAVILFGNQAGDSIVYRPNVHRSPNHQGDRGIFVIRF